MGDTCKCGNPSTFSSAPVVCTLCPYGYNGANCSLCPGATVIANSIVSSVCNGHGTCSTSAAGIPQCICFSGSPYDGPSCSSCLPGWINSSTTCLPCPALANAHNAGPYSGGAVLSSCYYKGECVVDSELGKAACEACSSGWVGDNCCDWDSGSSPWVVVLAVMSVVISLLLLAFKLGGTRTKIALLLLVPTLEVGRIDDVGHVDAGLVAVARVPFTRRPSANGALLP